MAKKRLEILTDVDRTAINKRIDDISTEYVFGFEETFVATANQVEFTLSKEFDKGMQAVDLYINGVKQPSSFFTEVNNKTIKTKKPIAQGDIVNIKAYKSKKTTEVKVIGHKDSHISGNDQLPVATESTKGLMAPEDKKKIKAVDMKVDSALEKITEHDTEIDNLKQSVSDGKEKVSVAITDKGVETAPDATFDVMATNIGKIETDPSIGTTDAVAGDLLEGKKMVSQGELMTGTMPNNGLVSKTITTQGGTQKISPGYYSGGEVKAQFNNLVPENVKNGVNIGGIVGSFPKKEVVGTETHTLWANGSKIVPNARSKGASLLLITASVNNSSDISQYVDFGDSSSSPVRVINDLRQYSFSVNKSGTNSWKISTGNNDRAIYFHLVYIK